MDEDQKKTGVTEENIPQSGGQAAQTVQDPVQPEPEAMEKQTPQVQVGGEAGDQGQMQTDAPGGGKKWVIVLTLVLIAGIGTVVVGFIAGRKAREARQQQREERVVAPVSEETDMLTEQYGQLSSSDEIADIEADLNATSLDGVDKELADIDQELAAEE